MQRRSQGLSPRGTGRNLDDQGCVNVNTRARRVVHTHTHIHTLETKVDRGGINGETRRTREAIEKIYTTVKRRGERQRGRNAYTSKTSSCGWGKKNDETKEARREEREEVIGDRRAGRRNGDREAGWMPGDEDSSGVSVVLFGKWEGWKREWARAWLWKQFVLSSLVKLFSDFGFPVAGWWKNTSHLAASRESSRSIVTRWDTTRPLACMRIYLWYIWSELRNCSLVKTWCFVEAMDFKLFSIIYYHYKYYIID